MFWLEFGFDVGIHCEQSMMSLPMSEISPSPWNRGFMSCADHPCVHALSCEDHVSAIAPNYLI